MGVFEGLPNPLEATRYHSLVVERSTLPDVLEITAETDDGLIMGLRHRELMVEGVQFHPESVLTAGGHDLVANFLARCATPACSARSRGLGRPGPCAAWNCTRPCPRRAGTR